MMMPRVRIQSFGIMPVPESKWKYKCQHQCVPCKCKPGTFPICNSIFCKIIYHHTTSITSYHCTKPICYHHKKSLCTSPDASGRFLFNKQRPGYIEEIKSHPIN